jgi:type I restriction enzyme R subunit
MTPELHTRKTLIDAQLRLAGWNLADPTQVVEEYVIDLVAAGVLPAVVGEKGLHYGKQYADYALIVRGRTPSPDPRLTPSAVLNPQRVG